MLSKLIKHEFKATARYFVPIFLVALILTPVTKLIIGVDIFKGFLSIIPGFFISAYAFSLIGIGVVTMVVIIMRFYKNLVSTEGYLMHTLPVTSSQHIISKLLVAFIWTIISVIVILLSLFVLFFFPKFNLTGESISWMLQIKNDFGDQGLVFLSQFVVLMVIGVLSKILFVYVSIAIGQVISRNKIIGAIVAGVVINIITQIITVIFLLPIVFVGANVNEPSIIVQWVFPISIIVTSIITVAYYLVTNYILKKKLNLE
jgi:hypothetical protein